MKKETIIGFSAIAITVLVLLFFRNVSISKSYMTEEKELTKAQMEKEAPLLEITEKDYYLRDFLLELDMVQDAFASDEPTVLLDTLRWNVDAEYFPAGFPLEEAFVIEETIGLDFQSGQTRILYEMNGKEHFHKTLAVSDKEGRNESIYTNHNNERFTKLEQRLEKMELTLK